MWVTVVLKTAGLDPVILRYQSEEIIGVKLGRNPVLKYGGGFQLGFEAWYRQGVGFESTPVHLLSHMQMPKYYLLPDHQQRC